LVEIPRPDILIDILPNLSSEVLNMLMVEFNLEDALSVRMEEGIEKGIKIGEARGEARGIAQGAEQKTLELAGKLLALGMEAEQISEVTGLSVGQIMALR
jgi:predicted transposase/invertase (TIGR01784 family)